MCPVLDRAAVVGTWYPGPRGLGTLSRTGPLLEAGGQTLALCTLCGACSAMCPVGASNHETVAGLRARLLESRPAASPEQHRMIPEVLESSGNVYGTRLEPVEGPRRSDAELAFFPGCAMSYFERDSAGAFVDLLESLGVGFSVVDGVCCGGPLDVLGLSPPPHSIARNQEAVEATGARTLVATCPRCVHRLSSDLVGIEVEHSLTTLGRLLPGTEVLASIRERLAGRVVTYHDPCELGRYRGRYDDARRLMELVGVELVEMEHSRERSACCGAGGGLRGVNPRLSREISRRRVAEAVATGAGTLLTECPSCLHNLRTGRNPVEVLVREGQFAAASLPRFVGPDLLCVSIHKPPARQDSRGWYGSGWLLGPTDEEFHGLIEYRPLEASPSLKWGSRPVVYTPWFVSPEYIWAPQEVVGHTLQLGLVGTAQPFDAVPDFPVVQDGAFLSQDALADHDRRACPVEDLVASQVDPLPSLFESFVDRVSVREFVDP